MSRRRFISGLGGALSGAGAGATTGATIGAAGGPIGAGAGAAIGAGIGLIGGLVSPEGELTDAEKEQLRLRQAELDQNQRQFDSTMQFNQGRAKQADRFQGIGILSNMRGQAADSARQYRFNNALYSALSGGGK